MDAIIIEPIADNHQYLQTVTVETELIARGSGELPP
jgi:hypothetical protein